MTKIILLSNGLPTLVDDDVFAWARHSKWSGGYGLGSAYAKRSVWVAGRLTNEYLHRLILPPPKGIEVDHINGDPLDNRRSNLRHVTRSQNEQNKRRARVDSTVGVRGVMTTRQGTYRARAQVNGVRYSVGPFLSLVEAAEAASALRKRVMTHAPECGESAW
jgi:hypothetical protein